MEERDLKRRPSTHLREIEIAKDLEDLTRRAAERFMGIGAGAMADHGFFTVSLSGGSTPKSLYKLLASEPFNNRLDWTRVFFFFGDERCVPPDSDESNYR